MTTGPLFLAVVGGVMATAVGKASILLVESRWRGRPYRTFQGKEKSLEGSVAMFGGAVVALILTMWVMQGRVQLELAMLAAVAAMCAEGVSINGWENLWVPLATGAVLALVPAGLAGPLGVGAALATTIGILAWQKESLTPSGVLGAILIGTLLFGLGGRTGGLALVGFFLSSSLLSKLFRTQKADVEADYAKTGTRDFAQAMANGGVAALAALLLGVTGDLRFMGALLGGLAAANADTWATELGVLSRTPPRLITTFKQASPGTSGAISLVGTLAAAGGAAFVGLVAALTQGRYWSLLPWLAVGGTVGALVDSLLGATLQGVYWCPTCEKETERPVHRCGTRTVLARGFEWLGNDQVNLLATAVGALIGFFAIR